jgi:hypothetical protein
MPGAGGPIVNNYNNIVIQAIDSQDIERFFKRGVPVMDEIFRQNKGGLTTNVNKYLGARK